MNKGKISIAIVNGVAAVICCIAVAIASSSITTRICENEKAIADITSNESADDNFVVDNGSYVNDSSFSDSSSSQEDSQPVDDFTDISQQSVAAVVADEDDQVANTKKISITSGLNSTDNAEILEYYKLVMEKNTKDGLGHSQTMTLTKLDGGSGGVGRFISWFEPIAKKVLADNSTSHEGLPGFTDQIKATDFNSAKAVNDGRYTTVTINVVEQTDGPYGKTNGGPVGRTIGVLDGVATALAEINGLQADFENGKLLLHYKNPRITIKVDNKTGALVKGACSWQYQVYVDIQKLDVSMMGISLTLNGAVGIVEMASSY